MEMRYTADKARFPRMTTAEVRQAFLLDNLFRPGALDLVYTDVDRAVVGSAVPTDGKLALAASKELASAYFAQRREVGVLNVGGPGSVTVDGQAYAMAALDCLYIGRGSKEIVFASATAAEPALFYLVSYPAHTTYPTRQARRADAEAVPLGSEKDANKRTIRKYIHPAGIPSCQLVMGYTELAEGSIWNTMPAHTHERRSEVYMYFNVDDDALVFHFMGTADETRHIAVRNRQAVLSPSWSIHSGAGTRRYAFVWAMGGENQEFGDMDHIAVKGLK